MASIFVKLLNLNISGGMLILLVFVFRFILMRTSRRATCLLWIVVGLRLIIPFSFESSLSIMPSGDFLVLDSDAKTDKAETALADVKDSDETVYYADMEPTGYLPHASEKSKDSINEIIKSAKDGSVTVQGNGSDETLYALPTHIPEKAIKDALDEDINNKYVDSGMSKDTGSNAVSQGNSFLGGFLNALPNRLGFQTRHFWDIMAYIWLLGFVVISGYAVIGYIQMKRITAEAIPYRDGGAENIFICDRIDTAFIFGIVKPRIYLPVNLQGKQLENVIAHENVHLIRYDHIRKIIGFMLLMVYWFNPLIWLAYAFFCKDIEFACDEQVISGMTRTEIKEYSDTLLFCSTNLHFMYGCPLAFGEVAVKDRVKAALSYKKPLFWVIILVFILLTGLGIFFFTKPSNKNDIDENIKTNYETEHRDYLVGEIIDVLANDFGVWDHRIVEYVIRITDPCSENRKEGDEIRFCESEEKSEFKDQTKYKIGDEIIIEHTSRQHCMEHNNSYIENAKVYYASEENLERFRNGSDSKNCDLIDNSNSGTLDTEHDGYDIAETFEAGDEVYYRLQNGKYKWGDYIYDYKLEIDDPQHGGKYIYLSNLPEITYEEVRRDTVLNAVQYHFLPDVAKFIDFIVDGKSTLERYRVDPYELSEVCYINDDRKYYKLKDGTYKYSATTYRYRLVISGRMPDDAYDSTFVYLSNVEEISFEKAWIAAGNSQNFSDYFSPSDAVCVGSYVGLFGKDGTAYDIPEKRIKEAILESVDPAEGITAEDIQYLNVYYGSFSGTGKSEAYCTCSLADRLHAGGLDFQPGVLVDLETGEVSCYNEFRSDEAQIQILRMDNGLNRILFIGKTESTGSKAYTVELFSLEDGIHEVETGFSEEFKAMITNADSVDYYSNGIGVTNSGEVRHWEWNSELGGFTYTAPDTPISLSDNSVDSILNAISYKYKYSLVNDFEFTYVLPDGTELKNDFGYKSGLLFIDYEKLWPRVSYFMKDRTQLYYLTVDKRSENGYLVISTGEDYLRENGIGYRICIKDDYVHLFSYDATSEEYLGSAEFKYNFTPNMYSIRRMLFTKDMYDIYVTSCPYEEEIDGPGIYPVNKGFLIDLDGDGTKEKVFIASCGWINYPEEENLEGWVGLSNHSDGDYETYYGIPGGVLVYINGKLMNDPLNVYGSEWSSPVFAFALTDVDVSDGRYEILVQDDLGDIFYIYTREQTSEYRVPGNPSGFSTRIPGSWLVRRVYDVGSDQKPRAEFTGVFNGDGTFTGPGDVSLYGYGLRLGSDNITWRMDKEGKVERVSDIFDVSLANIYTEETISQIENDASREYWEKLIKEHPEEVYLKLEITLKASKDYDDKSAITDNDRIELEPGYYYVDKTDGVSWIHIISPYSKVSGWFDMANLENYVKDYQSTGLDETEDYGKIDIIFSNINHAG